MGGERLNKTLLTPPELLPLGSLRPSGQPLTSTSAFRRSLMLTDAVIEPLTGEDGALEEVDPEEGHEDNLTNFTMGHA